MHTLWYTKHWRLSLFVWESMCCNNIQNQRMLW
jgi:hypothetical protein